MTLIETKMAAILVVGVFAISFDPVYSATTYTGNCQININKQLPPIQPLIFNAGSSDILLPQKSDIIKVDLRKQIRLVCPGLDNGFSFGKSNRTQDLTPHCVTNNIFSPGNGYVYPINELGCRKTADATAILSGSCLDKKFARIQVGFDLTKGEFATTMDLCFDQANYDAVYSAFKLTPNIVGRQHDVARPDFKESTFYEKIHISSLYSRQQQKKTIGKILGSDKLAEKYIRDDNSYFLARGHLSAKADFIYGSEQRSTFFYMNAAPQWQIFNAGNWEHLESDVRNYAAKRTSELIVVTGTWGNCSLPDVKGQMQPLHLYVDKNNNRAVKVPGYYWKVVYDPKTREGAAFVGLNNPFLEKSTVEDYVFCTDICEKFSWLTWDQHNVKRGYSFCCSMEEFRKTVTTVPDLEVKALLL